MTGGWSTTAADPATPVGLPAWVRDASATIDLDELCRAVVERDIEVAFPQHAHDTEFRDHLRASARENLDVLQDLLCGRRALQDVRLREPLAFGAVQARLRIPQTALQRSYRVGFLVKWAAWSRALRAGAELAGVPRDEALSALERTAAVLWGYQDHVASQVAESYAVVDDALSRSRAHVRQGLVRQLLREDTASLPPSDLVTLDYDLTASHLVVLLPATPQGAAGQLLVGLRTATGVQAALVHPLGLSSTAVWLGATGAWSAGARAALREVLRRAGAEASVSSSSSGLPGFRTALAQATDVERVRQGWGRASAPPVLEHADVRLEVLLLGDPSGARSFVEAELGPLSAATVEAARLRDTLDASFQAGSHVAAAEQLQLHEHTVRNRLHKAEQLLGHPLQERRTELQVALRLHRLLAAPQQGPAARPQGA